MENCWQEGNKHKVIVVNTDARAACAPKATVASPMLTLKSAQPHLHGLYNVSTSVSHGGGAGGGDEGGGGAGGGDEGGGGDKGGGEQTPWQTA